LLNGLILDLSAFSGMGTESMTRGPGWRFLDMGRRVERGVQAVALSFAIWLLEVGMFALFGKAFGLTLSMPAWMLIMVAAIVLFIAVIGVVKFMQIRAAIAAGASSYYLGRLRDIDIAGALVNLQAFDTTLRFADPYPAARSPQGRMLVIGPHGDYDEAQRRLTSATTFLLAATAAVVNAYKSDSLLPSYWSLYQQLKFAGTLYQQNIQAMATLAGLSQNATEAARSPFFRILGRIETLTHGGGGPCHPDDCHGTPYQYNNFMQFTLSQVSYWAGRPSFAHYQQEAMHRITEAWDGTDSAVWYMLTFPECDQRSTPRGCGGIK